MRKLIFFIPAGILVIQACQGTRPENLGSDGGSLEACPDKPNCVLSGATTEDHQIMPFPVQGSVGSSMQKLVSIIQGMPRTRIVTVTDRYLYAEFESALLRYVDDVEFMVAADGQSIQVRSASRLGYSDLGANRKRIETLRQAYTQ